MIADLGNGKYLFGYGRALIEDPDDPESRLGNSLAPFEYVVMEVDGDGNVLTEELVGTDFGWGPQDEPVNLGPGRVGWAYVPDPTPELNGASPGFEGRPPLNSRTNQLALFVYESAGG